MAGLRCKWKLASIGLFSRVCEVTFKGRGLVGGLGEVLWMADLARIVRAWVILIGVCTRGEVLRVALLVVSLPLTLSSIYLVGSVAVTQEAATIATTTLGPAQQRPGCIWARIAYAQIGGEGLVPVYLVGNTGDFLSMYGCKAAYAVGGASGALLSVEAWKSFAGRDIRFSTPLGVYSVGVVGFVECRYLGGSFAVVNFTVGEGGLRLCPQPLTQLEVVGDLGAGFSRLMLLLALLSLLPFAVASPLAFSRAVESISREISVLRGQGLGLGELESAVFLSLASVILVSSAYGVAAGVVIAHGALWALRFFGFTVFSRPLPPPTVLAPFTMHVVITILSGFLVTRFKVGRSESAC
ncbi:MAG: hypothetical protein B7L53_09245 [Thermofilum sp. NZ13]|nr:MAG: hypothetical protein B7L53_09245 [Thermofilum sp. NZ13]